MGENIGASARAMLNFGLDRMRLVDPRDGWPNPRAVAMASGAAGRVLDHAGVFPGVAEAIADCQMVFATTARGRELSKPVMTPEAAMRQARALIGQGARVAVLFGPERTGLENADLEGAGALISVPVNPEFPSLNLGQAVLLSAYEWSRAGFDGPEVVAGPGTEMATGLERDHLARHFEDDLERVGYFFPETKAEGMKANLRQMWGRLGLTRQDVQTLHGALRQLARRRDGDA